MTEPEIKALQLHRTLGGSVFDFTPERAAEILEIMALNLPKNGKRRHYYTARLTELLEDPPCSTSPTP